MAKTHKTFSYNFASRFPNLEITDNSALNTLANNKKAKLAFLFGSNASNINNCINLMKTQFMNDYFSSPFNNFDTFREDSGIFNDSSKYAFDSSNFDNQTIQLKSSVPYMAIVLFLANTEDITKFAIERSGYDSLSFVSLEVSGDDVGKMYIVKQGSSQYFSMNTNTSTANFVMSYQAETAKHITFTKNLTNCTITPDVDSIDLPTTTILRITANNGYRFDDTPTITINDVPYNFSENAGVYEYNLSGLSDTTDLQAVINAVAVEIPQIKTVNIETNLVNCEINKTVVDADTPTELLLTAESVQYIFNDTPTITINDVTNNFTVSQDKQTASYTLTANENDIISVNATAIFKYINITTNIVDCGINKTAVEIGKTETLILTADTDLLFNSVPTITINGVINNFTVSEDKKSATFEYTANAGDTVSIDAVATPTPKTATITKNLVNCTMTPDVDTYTEYTDLTLVFTCNENYSFNGVPYIDTNIYSGATEQINATKINDNEYSLTMPKTAFTDIQSINYSIDVHATAVFNTETVNKYGLICLYKPTKQNMIDLSKERFLRVGETDNYEDLGKYITSLKRIYLDVDSIGTNKIILGNHTTNINADMIDDDDIIIDLGNATITGEYKNEMDAKHAEIQVILPFISIVSLDAEKVMNKTINIKYKCNLITGVCIAYIYLIENDSLILLSTFNGVMGFDVPYILKPNNETIVNNSNVDASNIFNVPPKINIYENLKAETNNNIYDTFYIDTINNIKSGFVSIRKILSSNNSKIMLDDENVMLENVLKNGFII